MVEIFYAKKLTGRMGIPPKRFILGIRECEYVSLRMIYKFEFRIKMSEAQLQLRFVHDRGDQAGVRV